MFTTRRSAVAPKDASDLITKPFPVASTRNDNYAVLSIINAHTQPSLPYVAMRIYCTTATLDEAKKVCEEAYKNGFDDFDLHVVDLQHGFFPVPVESEVEALQTTYADDVLHKVMCGYQQARVSASNALAKRVDQKVEV